MCKLCESKPVYEFTNKRKLCKNCYLRWFEKKFLYIIRKFQMISKNDKISYEKKKDFRTIVLFEMFKMLEKKSPIEIVSKNKAKKLAVTDTIDIISEAIVNSLVKNNLKKKFDPIEKNIIRPLYLFLDREVLLYAKLQGLKFNKPKEDKKDKWVNFVNNLENKHPEIKRAIVNSYLESFG